MLLRFKTISPGRLLTEVKKLADRGAKLGQLPVSGKRELERRVRLKCSHDNIVSRYKSDAPVTYYLDAESTAARWSCLYSRIAAAASPGRPSSRRVVANRQ